MSQALPGSGQEAEAAPSADGWSDAPPSVDGAGDEPSLIRLGSDPAPDDLHAALLERGAGARVDASAVERLRTPVVQILLAAMRQATDAGRPMAVVSPSFAFSLTFEAFGLGGDHEPFTVEYS